MAKQPTGTKIALILGAIGLVGLALWWLAGSPDEAASDRLATPRTPGGEGTSDGPTARATADSGSQPEVPEAIDEEVPTVRPVFARARWGSGPGELGRSRPDEANPEAPMSLAGTGDGLVVLDQVNRRLVRFGPDGAPTGTTPLTMSEPQDLAIAPDGTTAVLDRLVDHTVTVLSPDGESLGTLPVEGEGIPEGGGVTAVVVDQGDVFVERENGPLVRIGDLHGNVAQTRDEIPGRPTKDGLSFILAGLIEAPAGRFYVTSIARDTGEHRYTRELTVPLILRQILMLDTDNAGIIYVAVAGAPYGATSEEQEEGLLLCLSPADGSTIGSAVLPPNTDPDETMRDMIVLPTGGVLYSIRSDEGVAVQRFDCR